MKISIKDDGLYCTVNENRDVKVGYSRQFNTVSVIRGNETLRTDLVRPGYGVSEFAEYCEKIKNIFQ